ncbi:MAG: RtcB family protein [Gemmatimonadetes bacterium]|nr:RtcB family protein [Gemmatimonadota bacterium]
MSDGHPGYVMPIGGVAAYRNQVSVVGVGFDMRLRQRRHHHDLDGPSSAEEGSDTRMVGNIADEIADVHLVRGGAEEPRPTATPKMDHPLFRRTPRGAPSR